MAPSRVQGLAAPVPQAVVGWLAACQLTWRRRVQADDSPAGLSVRRPLPPCQRLEHQATNRPTHTPPPPPPDPKAPQRRAHHTHRHGSISLPRLPPRGSGAVSSLARLETATAGSAQPSQVAEGRLR